MRLRLLLLLAVLVLATACGGGGGGSDSSGPSQLTISPGSVTLRAGDSQQFTARLGNAGNVSASWAVNGISGGNATVGTVDASGKYVAPAVLPTPNDVQITAASVTSSSSGTAKVTLLNPIANVSFFTPVALLANNAFTLTVSGSKFVDGAEVMLGSTALTTVVMDSTHLSATGVAPATAGVVNLTVVNPAPDGTPSNAKSVPIAVVPQRATVRLLEQSTFGPTPSQLIAVETGGMEKFLSDQFQAAASPYPDPDLNSQNIFDIAPTFFINALNSQANSDQLRQRAVFALNEIWVVSGNKVNQPKFYTPYLRVLAADAFSNYRTLMEDITLNPGMGLYLDMVNNAKPDPVAGTHANENYARELMQLFTIGPNVLNPDGTPVIQNGGFVATYDQNTIQAMARALTGWTFSGPPLNCAVNPYNDYFGAQAGLGPMLACDSNHDTDAKTILGTTLPAGQTAQADLDGALDIIFNHPNLPPFVAQRFIRNFVTSNPSPAYVTRVATAFANGVFTSNGKTFGGGHRGDMQALIAAVLLDPEARRGDNATTENPADGHLREPVLLFTNIYRTFNATTDGQNLVFAISGIGQTVFNAPSVFNFYSPTFAVPLEQPPIYGPEFQLFTASSSLNRVNLVEAAIFTGLSSGTQIDLSGIASLAGSPPDMVEALNQQLLHGTMNDAMKSQIINAVSAVDAGQPLARAQTAAYLICSSSQYQVQR